MEMAIWVEEKHKVTSYRKPSLGSIKTRTYSMYRKSSSAATSYNYGLPHSPQPSRNWGSNSPESQALAQSPKSVTQGSKIMGEVRRLIDGNCNINELKGSAIDVMINGSWDTNARIAS